jgi:hypothetical protein
VTTAKDWKFWLRTLGYPQKERAPRRNPSGLVAMYGNSISPSLGRIRVISRTGLYLETTERWPIGRILPLTLQKEDVSLQDSELQIDVETRVASHREDGVGLAFVLPEGMNAGLWEHLIDTADAADEVEDVKFIFRMVRAILFLYRICPSRSAEPILTITGDLDELRTKNMLSIALAAERMLAMMPDAENLRAHPHLVATILRDCSWEGDEIAQKLWAGLLVSSASREGDDLENLQYAELLVQVTACQAHILLEGCKRADETPAVDDGSERQPIIITPEEMIQVTGMYDHYRSATDIAYLHGFGLIERNFDFSTYAPKQNFDITPTPLGMRLYAACRGRLFHRSSVLS